MKTKEELEAELAAKRDEAEAHPDDEKKVDEYLEALNAWSKGIDELRKEIEDQQA